MRMRFAALALLLAILVSRPAAVAAQVRPDLPWRTIATARFRVHFTPELEALARRTLANAEWAYERLVRELPPPRGMIDIVVADNLDLANGFATPFPTNRVVVYARPPVDELTLRNHADWNQLLVAHELAHIFHLDRVGGWWRVGQRVFGRAAPLFPNAYAPRWLLEGVAIHYETALTGHGRLAGAEFPAHVRALAREQALPSLDAINTPRPFYPGGLTPYLLGGELVRATLRHDPARTEGEALARLIQVSSGRINPWRLDASARQAVGATFTELYAAWKDSVTRAAAGEPAADPAVRTLTAQGWTAAFPRFRDDGLLVYAADDARRMPGLYAVDERGTPRRLARRNSVDANSPVDARRTVYTEWDWTDPYTLRSDLYTGRGPWRRRLTVDERIAHVDVHAASGRMVAVRTLPGTTELITAEDAEAYPRVLVEGTAEVTWTEPRLSRDGTQVAAARWELGGRTSIVVLGLDGRERQRFAPRATDVPTRLAVVSSPTWLPGDTTVLFVSDHDGRPMVYRGDVRTGAYAVLWETRTALRQPDVSPDGSRMAAVELRASGWQVVTRETPAVAALPDGPPERDREPLPAPPIVPRLADDLDEPYRGASLAAPTWWLPAIGDVSDEGFLRVGAITGGSDPVGRHSYQIRVARDVVRAQEFLWDAGYAYAGLGNPVLSVGTRSEWVHGAIVNSADERVATLSRNDRTLTASVYLARPRHRLSTYVMLAPELGIRSYRTTPSLAIVSLGDPELLDVDLFPRLALSAGVSSMQRPGLSVSVEDGVAVQATLRRRFNAGIGATAVNEAILDASVAKSLPLPGFARHVVAARAALGTVDAGSTNFFSIGGVNGSTVELLPGLAIGDPRRTFFVRGFVPGIQFGTRAAAASAEYRVPIARVGRGLSLLPVSLQKLSALAFADAGSAWCANTIRQAPPCQAGPTGPRWMTSVGGELLLDTVLEYDVLYRMRLGFAAPMRSPEFARPPASIYVSFGSTF